MAQTKSIQRKKSGGRVAERPAPEVKPTILAAAPIVDLEEVESVPIAAEDAESPLGDVESDLLGEEITLDDDELNPFGDKWEQ